jgi:hypothetical protein
MYERKKNMREGKKSDICRCYERLKDKTGGSQSLAHTRWRKCTDNFKFQELIIWNFRCTTIENIPFLLMSFFPNIRRFVFTHQRVARTVNWICSVGARNRSKVIDKWCDKASIPTRSWRLERACTAGWGYISQAWTQAVTSCLVRNSNS